ncbi:hypothetical protein OCF13_28750, partial [Bacillus tropicus]|nr:hypothetical protein [Bacillus tropicus]
VGNGVEGITQMVDTNGRYYWHSTLAKTPFYYDIKADNFVVSAANTNLVTKAKDGRSTLTPTADAELIGANGIIADRRGNTVHLRVPARLKVGATGSVVTTLPVDMRPTMTFLHNIISNDGKVARLTINTDGTVAFSQISSTQITGADFYVSVSYVVD